VGPWSAALVMSIDNWELTGASITNGVALIRFKRELNTGDDLYDIPLAPELARNFIWARGRAFYPFLLCFLRRYPFLLTMGSPPPPTPVFQPPPPPLLSSACQTLPIQFRLRIFEANILMISRTQ